VETEVVTVDALELGRGVGSLLLDAAGTLARRAGWRRLWLVTTNDNTAALRFYQSWLGSRRVPPQCFGAVTIAEAIDSPTGSRFDPDSA
jgi:GNAT superfamily N-acetyltransferase